MHLEDPTFPEGLRLLADWQADDPMAKQRLEEIFGAAVEGKYDESFARAAPPDAVHVSGSIDLLTLGMIHNLYGVTAAEFYKENPLRYVRSVLITLRLLGMPKRYLSWPVYGFTAEALGQVMIYSDRFSPGTDPEDTLVDADTWQSVTTPDMASGIPRVLDETLAHYKRITGLEPVLHLSAPYSLAADIYGQEHLINALTHEPVFVDTFLDHLADTVHAPWIDHFFRQYPNGWVELSDASGSPFFIGPGNCKNVAIRSIQRLVDENPWGARVYIANYRGDYVTQTSPRAGSSSRRRTSRVREGTSVSLADLFDAKNSVCRDYVIRLADDRVAASFYVEKAIERNIPLFMGIGATQIDRNSVADLETARNEIAATAGEYVEAIKTVACAIEQNGYDSTVPPWPGTVYFEDVSMESNFELIEIIVGIARNQGAL